MSLMYFILVLFLIALDIMFTIILFNGLKILFNTRMSLIFTIIEVGLLVACEIFGVFGLVDYMLIAFSLALSMIITITLYIAISRK